LEPSIFGLKPSYDMVRLIADFIAKYMTSPNLEIEAKLGRLVDKDTKQRILDPTLSFANLWVDSALTSVVIAPEQSWLRFESNMTLGKRIAYKHTREVDCYYKHDGIKVRVTTDQDTSQVLASITKEKIADLNIYSPRTPFDFRISVNEEKPGKPCTFLHQLAFTIPEETSPLLERQKDRISYKHDIFSFDLTQVTVPAEKPRVNPYATGPPQPPPEPKLVHELEIEIMNSSAVFEERTRYVSGQPNQLFEVAQVFLNNIKVLAKQAPQSPSRTA
ncbi:mRNA-capping enzyme subunit beta, partial [Spiromyces aspiralis]